MPSLDFTATGQPVDVIATLGLTSGTNYQGQNLSTVATLFMRAAATAPAAGSRANRIEAGGTFNIRPTGDPVFLWTDDDAGCPVILNEAP